MANGPQLKVVNFDDGAYIYVEGKRSDNFHIITQGKVQVTGAEEQLLVAGDFVGIVSVMSDHAHFDNAQAMGPVALITINRKQFISVIQNNPSVAMKVILEFSRRMRSLNDELAAATNKPVANEEDTSVLFKTAEYLEKEKRLSQAYYAYMKYTLRFPRGEFVEAAKVRMDALFDSAPPALVGGVARFYPKGSFVFADGEKGSELFMILSGQVQICKVLGDSEIIFAILKTGDIFGEMAIMEDKPRSASAIAYEDSKLMVVAKDNFEGMAVTKPDLIERLTIMLAERIWAAYKQLANTTIEDPVARMYDVLAVDMEKNHFVPDDKTPYTWSFGLNEIAKMTSIPDADAKQAIAKFSLDKNFQIRSNEIMALDSLEVAKQAEFYKGKQRREKARDEIKKFR